MNKCYSKLVVIIFLAIAVTGCKIDPPLNPDGTPLTPGSTSGSSGTSISYTLDGKTTKFTIGFFQVISASIIPPNGSVQIGGGLDPATSFSLIAATSATGTFNADIITIGKNLLGEGKVTFTEIKTTDNTGLKGTVKGTFTGKVKDLTDFTEKEISGSFSINM
ncbi:hypothetical protein E2R65_06060 [Mucilaginibacter phyllosphaerae]|nr:hypothetical protein [Mucilaginibacter phyllosphaerae]TEW67550.1 hypothetical protein E2R65_06060 [Mucilaginibacter phyllosphaerae]